MVLTVYLPVRSTIDKTVAGDLLKLNLEYRQPTASCVCKITGCPTLAGYLTGTSRLQGVIQSVLCNRVVFLARSPSELAIVSDKSSVRVPLRIKGESSKKAWSKVS